MVRIDIDDFVGNGMWFLVNYIPFDDPKSLAWISIEESTKGGYLVYEVDSCYFEGDITTNDYRYIGGTSNKRHLICDKKFRAKEEMKIYEPCNPITLAEVFKSE